MTEQTRSLTAIDTPAPGYALAIVEMRQRLAAIQQLYKDVMVPETDYGIIPGTQKPTLLQPGAQLLDMLAGNSPIFEELPGCIRDWERGFFHFEIRCKLIHKASGDVVAEGIGACNSREDRYRWRQSKPVCPTCQVEAIAKSKEEWGGGWYCNKKAGGCGAKFAKDDERITSQPVGRVENDEPYTLVNTLLKMAQKRAHVAATLNATGASRIFTQDIEDMVPVGEDVTAERANEPTQPRTATRPASRQASAPAQTSQNAKLLCEDCKKPIAALQTAKGVASPEAVAKATLSRYGRQLCHSCGEKEEARRQREEHETATSQQLDSAPQDGGDEGDDPNAPLF